MRIGFVTGSISRIGSGRAEAVPLARAFRRLGHDAFGLETTRFNRDQTKVDDLDVHFEPIASYLASRPLQFVRALPQRFDATAHAARFNALRPSDLAIGDALVALGDRLDLDVVYAFHNTNVARVLGGWPHPSRLLVINLIGFGIDPSRGGAADTFPLQRLIFERPHWDLHVAATRFEYEQYCGVYDRLGIDRRKLVHLPHSYDEELFHPPAHLNGSRRYGAAAGARIILYPVNVYPRKNIELAIDVIAELNTVENCKLIVTGNVWDQEYHALLLRHAAKRGVSNKVEFLKGVPIETLVQLYVDADVTIYTSHQETFGHGIVESLGCGTSVVGPDWIHPCREILTEAHGGWAAPRDAQGFASAIRESFAAGCRPEDVAASASARYGNTAVASRFLELCQEIRAEKTEYGSTLASINWKELYRDAGDLLKV
jgi:glycosyltransferase involved in cell wall biosynthesis